LPPYPVLDEILKLYIEYDLSANAIIAEGFEADTVRRVLRLVDLNEYKRRQAAVGPRITQRGFGRDRRYPITSGWRLGDCTRRRGLAASPHAPYTTRPFAFRVRFIHANRPGSHGGAGRRPAARPADPRGRHRPVR